MGWRESYREASFRNVKFFVERAETAFGRRTVTHEFPNREEPTVEDLGRKARRFTVEAYVLGDDYLGQKEQLIQAAEKKGAGKLVHPYYGSLSVVCTGCSVRDSSDELRVCRIQFDFVEAGVADSPGVSANAKTTAANTKKSLMDAINARAAELYQLAGLPFSELEALLDTIDAAYTAIDAVKQTVADVAEYKRAIETALAAPAAFMASGQDLFRSLIDLTTYGTYPTGTFKINAINARRQFEEQRKLFAFAPTVPASPESPRSVVAAAMQWIATGTAGGMIAESEYETYEDADTAARIVLNQIDLMLDAGLPDDLHELFRRQRAEIIDDLKQRSETLNRLAQLTLPEGVPALVLSNELYGTLEYADDILKRNGIDHPGFIPSNVELSVIVNV